MKTILCLAIAAFLFSSCEKEILVEDHTLTGVSEKYLDEGLVACWKFDEETGKYFYNETSGQLTGQKYGATWVTGVVGSALKYDGVNDYAKVSGINSHVLGDMTQGSISIWFRYADSLDNGSKPIQPLMYIGKSDTTGNDDCFIIEIGHNDPQNSTLYFTWIRNGELPLCFSSAQNLTPETWYHFVGMVGDHVNDYGQNNTGYLNGVEMTDRNYNYGDPFTKVFFKMYPSGELQNIWFGYGKTRDSHTPDFEFLAGVVDEIRIYNRPLTSQEVLTLYQQGNQNVPPVISVQVSGGPFYTEPTDIIATATATDPDGSVVRVEFYLDGVLRFSDLAAPYKFKFTGIMAGNHTILVKAIDNAGFSSETSRVINVRAQH